MPIYEFECEACGREFDELVSLSADLNKIACPKCGTRKARKLLSVFATSGKGGGSSSNSSCTTCSTHSCATCH